VCSALILLTGEARDYLLALVQCKVPFELAFMVMTAVHFLPILRGEALDVYHAVQMRGTEVAKASLRDKLRVYTRITLPIVAGAIKRAEQVSIAMEARAFRATPRRTFMRRLTLAPRDVASLIAVPLLAAAALAASLAA
jgi:energy-coupling factor transport system permease protein